MSAQPGTAPALTRRVPATVSVVLPVYNGERYLARTLRSLLGQEYADFDLLIADNCSTDATEEIIRELTRGDDRVRYLRRDRNVGYIENYNRLTREAPGSLLAYTASDDEYQPRWLTSLKCALDNRPDAVLSFSAGVDIDASGRELGRWRNACRTNHSEPAIRVRDLFAVDHNACQLYGLIRRDLLVRTGLQPPLKSSDRLLLAELALLGPFVFVDEPLLLRRRHLAQSSELCDPRTDYYGMDRRFRMPNVDEGRWLLRTVARASLPINQRIRVYAALRPWLRRNAVPMARNVASALAEVVTKRTAR